MPASLTPFPRCSRLLIALGVLGGLASFSAPSWSAPVAAPLSAPVTAPSAQAGDAAPAATPDAGKAPLSSGMDATLFYQVLFGEMQLSSGQPGVAYQIYMELARKHRSAEMFRRAVNIAWEARSGDDALNAARAWRQALPRSLEAAQFEARIGLVMGRSDVADSLRSIIELNPADKRGPIMASLPRMLSRLPDRQQAATVIDSVTEPWRSGPDALPEAWVASAEGWLAAKDTPRAMQAARRAEALAPQHLSVGLLAVSLMDTQPEAEATVQRQLAQPEAPVLLRLAYARKLAASQRLNDAAQQLDLIVAAQPENAEAWLTLGAVRLEARQPDAAEVALKRFITLKTQAAPVAMPPAGTPLNPEQTQWLLANATLNQAYLLLSQAHEQRGQIPQAIGWLDKVDAEHDLLLVQSQRARLLARQGKLAQARAAIRSVPESEPRDHLLKLRTEAQLLRDLDQWPLAYQVLEEATSRFPQDADLVYEQAMAAERLQKFDAMEKLLRSAMKLEPDNAHPYNALGYSLANRNIRLKEARQLLERAATLRPGDPFITDSLGWLNFREGRLGEASTLLRQAYQQRPDAEIAAHLGEVLWVQGKTEEARRIWNAALPLGADNEVLKETLQRLRVQP